MTMTIGELIAVLEEKAEQYGEETEVRIAIQPSWPLQSHISGVVGSDQIKDDEEYDEDEDEDEKEEEESKEEKIIWLVEGGQCRPNPYAPKALWDLV